MDAGSKVHGTSGAPQELVGQILIPALQGSFVGAFAVGGPFARLSGRRNWTIFLLTTVKAVDKPKACKTLTLPLHI